MDSPACPLCRNGATMDVDHLLDCSALTKNCIYSRYWGAKDSLNSLTYWQFASLLLTFLVLLMFTLFLLFKYFMSVKLDVHCLIFIFLISIRHKNKACIACCIGNKKKSPNKYSDRQTNLSYGNRTNIGI